MARAGFSQYQSYTMQKNNRRKILRAVRWILLVYLGFLILTGSVVHTLSLQNGSMDPTLKPGSAVIATPLTMGANLLFLPFGLPAFRTPERGEIVELTPPYHRDRNGFVETLDDVLRFVTLNLVSLDRGLRKDWDNAITVKRIIGIPGDTIKLEGFTAQIKPKNQGYALSEFELTKKIYNLKKEALPAGWDKTYPFSGSLDEITLGDDEYFVLGDNRSASGDSRSWGVVKRSQIRASVIFKYWPFSDFGSL